MNTISRRSFLKRSTFAVGASLTGIVLRSSARADPSGANDAIGVAIIGLGNKGRQHFKLLAARGDVRVVALCDVDPKRIASALEKVTGSRFSPFTTTDVREVMARRDVDAVVIATGNHWHALLAVWACQAGKDVYVEKPMTHTVWEGRKMIEAAQKYSRIVQVGTQYRSEVGLAEGIAFIHSGQLGKLKHVHAVYYGRRESIGRRDAWYPQWLNYDIFCGPTPVIPLDRDQLHYDWHWSWATGNGELGNNGVHLLDIALRIVRADTPPRRVLGLGGRFVIDDAADTPNSQLAVYDFPAAPVIYEGRGLPAKPGVAFMDQVGGIRVGVVAHCEGGYVSGLVGCTAFAPNGKVIRKFAGDGGAGHMTNFLAAVRSRRPEDLAAPVTVGHVSAACCHYGNISLRVGKAGGSAKIARALEPIPAAAEIGHALQAHLGLHGVDLRKQPLTVGPWLEIDSATDAITRAEPANEASLGRARYLLRETQRPPYVIPEQV